MIHDRAYLVPAACQSGILPQLSRKEPLPLKGHYLPCRDRTWPKAQALGHSVTSAAARASASRRSTSTTASFLDICT